MDRMTLTLILCSMAQSIVIKPPSADQIMIPPEFLTTCAHDEYTDLAVIAWPGDSCAAAARNIPENPSINTAYPLSCPPVITNSKCFPISEDAAPAYDPHDQAQLELRSQIQDADPSLPSPTLYIARSASLRWPDRMTHALFFSDRACQHMDQSVHAWYVEREGLRAEQCVDLSGWRGRFGSVEFMRREEWEVWTARRTAGEDGNVKAGWGWRGFL